MTVYKLLKPYRFILLLLCLVVLMFIHSHIDSNHFTIDGIAMYRAPNGYQFHNHRLRLWYEGRCIDATDNGKLIVTFCDPEMEQSFSLTTDHKLVYERLGKCLHSIPTGEESVGVVLLDCSKVSSLITLEDNGGFFLQEIVSDKELCLTPTSQSNHFQPTERPCLNDPIRLTKCDKNASRLVLMEESQFQEDRRLLRSAMIQPESSCDFKACGFNIREPVKIISSDKVTKCVNISVCVTVVVKTSRRPHLILRLAKSIRNSVGHDLPIVVYDDGPDDLSNDTRRSIAQYPLLRYIVSNNVDLGIGKGRMLGVMQVKTKYFFLLDDDMVATQKTNFQKMVDVLDNTDASVVSACASNGGCGFSGFMKFGYFNENRSKRRLGHFKGACQLANQTIPGFAGCIRCDITSNIFLARTDDVLTIGGWDPELKIVEHKDFFIRLKAAGMKLVKCEDIAVYHGRPSREGDQQVEGFIEKRRRGGSRFKNLILNRWNLHSSFEQGSESYTINKLGYIEYVHKHDNKGHC